MLILIPGITGNLGKELCAAALAAGHRVRGLGRSPEKLPAELSSRLESFVRSTSYADVAAFDRACSGGVDVVIVAWSAHPLLQLDGQLLLLRAAERAGIRRFHSASWNLDWTRCGHGDLVTYDGLKAFARHALCTSRIRVTHVFVGVLAKTLFAVPGAGALEADSAMWVRGDGQTRVLQSPGGDSWRMNFTPEEDAAAFSVALMTSELGDRGGFYRFCSDTFSPRELKLAFEEVRPGADVTCRTLMPLEAIKKLADDAKAKAEAAGPEMFQMQYVAIAGLEYGYWMPSEKMLFDPVDVAKFPHVKRTSVREYIRKNPWV
ncbi:hypothetical protein PpBr36_04017 [Pyricularia pennisetigena]|uniref:hypothetical protein n=1 Tax=Pyricularia pennisetigena TaxID=1578925 RepID=UPI001151D49E|nr:hypothetical protein PpBr36_04017 [Pyricularia pennisetigena]TLS26980.1 hypothetical protein PpBr36_04017 [Pyricularia pennisetigena]